MNWSYIFQAYFLHYLKVSNCSWIGTRVIFFSCSSPFSSISEVIFWTLLMGELKSCIRKLLKSGWYFRKLSYYIHTAERSKIKNNVEFELILPRKTASIFSLDTVQIYFRICFFIYTCRKWWAEAFIEEKTGFPWKINVDGDWIGVCTGGFIVVFVNLKLNYIILLGMYISKILFCKAQIVKGDENEYIWFNTFSVLLKGKVQFLSQILCCLI